MIPKPPSQPATTPRRRPRAAQSDRPTLTSCSAAFAAPKPLSEEDVFITSAHIDAGRPASSTQAGDDYQASPMPHPPAAPRASYHTSPYVPRTWRKYTLPASYHADRRRARTAAQRWRGIDRDRGTEVAKRLTPAEWCKWCRRRGLRLREWASLFPTTLHDVEAYDYNSGAVGGDHPWSKHARRLVLRERRMREDLIGGVVDLEQLLHDVALTQGTSAEVGPPSCTSGYCVLDDGHAVSPIRVSSLRTACCAAVVPSGAEAVLVLPLTETEEGSHEWTQDEAMASVLWEEAQRPLPPGREWDRQYAIRAAVGTTVQEAILDLRLDPRYRRPGQLLSRRYTLRE